MATFTPSIAVPGYQPDVIPNLSDLETRERLSPAALKAFFAILDKWEIDGNTGANLLGGLSRASIYNLKRSTRTLSQDELMRVSYIIGIYKALHILFSKTLANQWMKRPNDNPLFLGHTPLEYVLYQGIPGLQNVRNLLDASIQE
jgi:uncharacterized protein (DUF2384 family)